MSQWKSFSLLLVITALFVGAPFAQASADVDMKRLPVCEDEDGRRMEPNNEQVIAWKSSTPSRWQNRALVVGVVAEVLPNKNGHVHLDVDLGEGLGKGFRNHVEIIYNLKFGELVDVQEGSQIVACGDYITATERNGNYPPSPMGAIIHWVHTSPRPREHASGYLVIDGKHYGSYNPQDRY